MKMKMMAAIVASVMVFCACADLVPSNSYDVSAYSEDGIDGAMLTLMFWGG